MRPKEIKRIPKNKPFDFSSFKAGEIIDGRHHCGLKINVETMQQANFTTNSGGSPIQVRESGEYENKGFFLSSAFNWQIVEDEAGLKVLVPTRRE